MDNDRKKFAVQRKKLQKAIDKSVKMWYNKRCKKVPAFLKFLDKRGFMW